MPTSRGDGGAVFGGAGGAHPIGCRLTLALALFLPPIPPTPFPSGDGGDFCLFRRGLRPRHPGIKPPAALTEPAAVVPGGAGFAPGGGLNPGGTCYPCPGGEDHLKRRRRLRRIVPSPPVPPLLGCRHCLPVPRLNCHAPAGYRNATPAPSRKGQSPTPGTRLAGSVSAARAQSRGCKGRSPLHEITLVSPFPAGEERSASAGWGDRGQTNKLKAGATGNQKGKPPPSGTTAAGIASAAGGKAAIEFSTAAGIASAAGGKPPPKTLPHQSQYPANAPSRYTAERKTPEPSRRAKTSSPEEGSPVYVYASRKLPAPAA